MNLLCYSDLHFADPHLIEAMAACRELAAAILEYRPDVVVNLGDTFHTKDHVSALSLSAAARSFSEIRDAVESVGAKHYAIAGNHDVASTSGDASSSDVLRLARVTMVPSGETDATGRFGFLGYVADPTLYRSAIHSLREAQCQFIFAHVPILGAAFNRQAREAGSNALNPDDLGSVPLVLAGHYHHPQEIPGLRTRTIIVGSPCYYTWGDEVVFDEHDAIVPRGFLLVGGEYPNWSVTRIPNRKATIRHTVRSGEDPLAVAEQIRAAHPGQQVRIRVVGEHSVDQVRELRGSVPDDVQLTASSALRTVTLPDEIEVSFSPLALDLDALVDRVLGVSDLGGVPVKQVREEVLNLLQEVKETGNE